MKKLYISSNIRYLRTKYHLKQQDVGVACNKSANAIGNYEAGIREPSALDIWNMSILFNVSIDDLIVKDLRLEDSKTDEIEQLYQNNKDSLNDDDKQMIKYIIEKRSNK